MVCFLLRSDFTPTCVFGRNITAVVVGRMNLHAVSERTNTLDVTGSCPPCMDGYGCHTKLGMIRTIKRLPRGLRLTVVLLLPAGVSDCGGVDGGC